MGFFLSLDGGGCQASSGSVIRCFVSVSVSLNSVSSFASRYSIPNPVCKSGGKTPNKTPVNIDWVNPRVTRVVNPAGSKRKLKAPIAAIIFNLLYRVCLKLALMLFLGERLSMIHAGVASSVFTDRYIPGTKKKIVPLITAIELMKIVPIRCGSFFTV